MTFLCLVIGLLYPFASLLLLGKRLSLEDLRKELPVWKKRICVVMKHTPQHSRRALLKKLVIRPSSYTFPSLSFPSYYTIEYSHYQCAKYLITISLPVNYDVLLLTWLLIYPSDGLTGGSLTPNIISRLTPFAPEKEKEMGEGVRITIR